MANFLRFSTTGYLSVVLTVIACNLTLSNLKEWLFPLRAAPPCVRSQEITPVRIQEVDPFAYRNVLEAVPVVIRPGGSFDALPVEVTNEVKIAD